MEALGPQTCQAVLSRGHTRPEPQGLVPESSLPRVRSGSASSVFCQHWSGISGNPTLRNTSQLILFTGELPAFASP